MLDIMRKKSGSVVMYFILGAIILVFTFTFGPSAGPSCGGSSADFAAIVDGDPIRQQDFAVFYQQRVDQMRQSFAGSGQDLDPEFLKRLGLRKQVLDGLIDRKLLAHEAESRGLSVSDNELLEYMKENFGLENVTGEQFEAFVNRYYRMPVWRFEEDVRSEILGQKIADVITDNLAVSETQVKQDYFKEYDRVMVSFVRFDVKSKDQAEPTPEQIATLLKDEAEAAQARFSKDAPLYQTPKQVQARQILRKLERDASAEEIAAAMTYLVGVKKKLDEGAKFEELAKTESQDESTAEKGGDMGFFSRTQVVKSLADAAFSLKVGEMTAMPVKTRLGVHLLRVEQIKESTTQGFEEVKEKVAASILKERAAQTAAMATAQAMIDAVQGGKKLEELTQTESQARENPEATLPLARVSPWIRKTDTSIPRIGFSEEFHKAVFALNDEAPLVATPYKVGNAYFVAEYVSREEPTDEDFQERKDSLVKQALSSKRQRVLRDWIAHLRTEATVELNPNLLGDDA
jgi:peptidyl-prolyl cis-trans isomerase D